MKVTWLVPWVTAAVVVSLGTLLLTIGARSPYTHANFQPGPDQSYTRTEQILVGSPVPYTGPGLAQPLPTSAGPIVRGGELIVGAGCASCHGLEGRGGPVAPPIIGFNAADFRAKMDKGPGGMPVFAHRALTDDELAAIEVYLKALAK